ncbi:MAG: sporulation protein YunB, partial [Clostridia bacterium]|nr:sporulation protein YunB [Clostridia bacterium]
SIDSPHSNFLVKWLREGYVVQRKNKKIRKLFLFSLSILLIVSIISITVFFKVKPLIFTYAKSCAETILLNAENKAVLNILEKENITYDEISKISRDSSNNITGIEINIDQINTLKSSISNKISDIVSEKNIYDLYIPAGTLIGNEYTTGFGPKIKFRMQLTETAVVDFESNFIEAGINHVLHQILITINISANILMIGCTQAFYVSTSAIAAQTVIVGIVPDSFTNVEEHPGDDIADEIFNYADLY